MVWIEWGTPAERWSLEVASLVRYAACTIFFHTFITNFNPLVLSLGFLRILYHFFFTFYSHTLFFPSYLSLSTVDPILSHLEDAKPGIKVLNVTATRCRLSAVVHKMGPTLFLNHEYHPLCSGLIRIKVHSITTPKQQTAPNPIH